MFYPQLSFYRYNYFLQQFYGAESHRKLLCYQNRCRLSFQVAFLHCFNIGISFTQQFEPVSRENDCDGVTFIGHDPNVIEIPYKKSEEILPYDRQTHLDDIYDPRFTGYGTSYRSYLEPVTGQTRFYYDDIDAYKRPNYLCRSKVDHIPSSISV